jgi:hypothetical protein
MSDQFVGLISGPLAAVALFAGAALAYARWQRRGDPLALISSAFAVGIGGVARYDLFVVGLAMSAFVLIAPVPAARGASAGRGRRDARPAYATAHAAAVTGVLGLWLLVAVVTQGYPFAFASSTLLEDIVRSYPVRQVTHR